MLTPLLLHLHLPKTAGITLFDILDRKFGFRRGLEALNTFSEIDKIISRQTELNAISGHFPYGVDALFERPCTYVVLLRNPVQRVISNFFYIRQEQGHPQQQQFATLTLDEFAKLHDFDIDNAQTRRLQPGDVRSEQFWQTWPAITPFGAVNLTHLNHAKAALDRCTVVGTSERFDDTLALARAKLGVDFPTKYTRYNVGKRPRTDEVSTETKEILTDRNRIDMELYHYADTLLTQRLAEFAVPTER